MCIPFDLWLITRPWPLPQRFAIASISSSRRVYDSFSSIRRNCTYFWDEKTEEGERLRMIRQDTTESKLCQDNQSVFYKLPVIAKCVNKIENELEQRYKNGLTEHEKEMDRTGQNNA